MPVDDPTVVDAVGIENASGVVVLTISDHLEWEHVDHLRSLQSKLNKYFGFVESGELLKAYPDAQHRPVRIEVVCRCPPNAAGELFLGKAKAVAEAAGWSFSWRVVHVA